jgi:uncharacterized protein YbjT (DUF2867 family)
LSKPETLASAFDGTQTLFLVSSIGVDTVALQHNAIEAARKAGVKHIVKLSALVLRVIQRRHFHDRVAW